jgi:hypothetical protein
MPKLTTQDLPTYYSMVNDSVPQAQQLRGLVSLLQTSQDKCNNQTIRDNVDMDTVLNYINLNLLQAQNSTTTLLVHLECSKHSGIIHTY